MAGAKTQKMDLSDGELSDDGGGEEDLDTSVCKTCNLTFKNSKVKYVNHNYSRASCNINIVALSLCSVDCHLKKSIIIC